MMSALLVLVIVLAVHSLVLPGSGEGLRFYLLPDFKRAADVGIGKSDHRGHESGFLHPESWYRCHGDFRQLYAGRQNAHRRIVRICGLDTFVALMSGLIHFPGMFLIRDSAGCRSVADLRDIAECLCEYGGRPSVGNIIFPVYDLCQLFDGHCCI